MRGIYLLLISVEKEIEVEVGALGKVNFNPGYYTYVGSAQKNLDARVERHLSNNKKKFWHIDYLLDNKNVEVVDVFYKEAGKEEECKTARELENRFPSVKGFGCSDCNCRSHLFRN